MRKKVSLFMLLFVVFTLSGCSNAKNENHILFTKDRFKVDAAGNVQISGKVSRLSKGDYKANIDRENQIIHLDKNGEFTLDTFIVNSTQKIFPIGIETPDGEIIVESAQLDTDKFTKSLSLKQYTSPIDIVNSYKEATLSIESEREVSSEEFPFKFYEGITFSNGATKINDNITILSFEKDSHFDIAREYLITKLEEIQNDVQINGQLNNDPLKRNHSNTEDLVMNNEVFKQILLNNEKERQFAEMNPLYHSKIACYQEKKIIMVCENGVSDSQFMLYKQIINNFKNQ